MYIALYFPRLSIEVFGHNDNPMALSGPRGIVQANTAASALGVAQGMRRATAMALAPDLFLTKASPEREADALKQISCWAAQFTPQLCYFNQHTMILLSVSASLRLFGGIHAIANALLQGASDMGFSCQAACASTARAARLLAQAGDPNQVLQVYTSQAQVNRALLSLPCTQLEQSKACIDTLLSMGITTVRDLMQLPRSGLTQRFGKALLQELDQAFGKQDEAFEWFKVPAQFAIKHELFSQVDNASALLFSAKRMLIQLSGWLSARQAAVQSLTFHALHDDADSTEITLEFSEPTRQIERMVLILRERLDKTVLPEATHTLTLQCLNVESQAHANAELFLNTATQQSDLRRLVERLQARLGRDQIVRLELEADHRPEAAQSLKHYLATASKPNKINKNLPTLTEIHGLPRPLWLYPQAIAISERQSRPWFKGPVQLLAGPERIEGQWWASGPGDSGLVERDYFIGLTQDLNMLWLFRSQSWFVQGIFG